MAGAQSPLKKFHAMPVEVKDTYLFLLKRKERQIMGDPVSRENFIFHFREIPDWLRQSPIAFSLLAEFARRARRNEGDVAWDGESIPLRPGQFITGRLSVSQRLGITENEYRGAYKKLCRYGLIKTISSTNKYTIGLLCADNVFYINPSDDSPAEAPPKPPPLNQQVTTINKDNTDNNVNSRLVKPRDYKNTEIYKRLTAKKSY